VVGYSTEPRGFSFFQNIQFSSTAYHMFIKCHALFPGVEGPEHEGEGLPPSNAEVKNEWSFTSTHPYAFMLWTETRLTSPCVSVGITKESESVSNSGMDGKEFDS
jgi:hypothetical protein